MGLWDWAVTAYSRPGAAQAFLALQDDHGQNTCLLLFSAWARTEDPLVLGRAAERGDGRGFGGAALEEARQLRSPVEHRRETGQGQHIDIALFDVQAAMLASTRLERTVTGSTFSLILSRRAGSAEPKTMRCTRL